MLKKLQNHSFTKYCVLCFLGVFSALNYELFIFTNNFAPAGLNGMATMIQFLFNFNIGYLSLLINIPLLLICYFKISHLFSIRTLFFILSFSLANLIFRSLDLSNIVFTAKDGGEAIMAAVAGGVFNGFIYNATFRLKASTGGNDIVAAMINKKKPEFEFVWLIFTFNALIAFSSFFVYGKNFRAVILCIIYSFVTTSVNDLMLKGAKSAIKFEVITNKPVELSQTLMKKLKHGCTVVSAKGMYSDTDKYIIICVVNKHQLADFENVIKRFNGTFTIASPVSLTLGNFKHIK